MKSLSRREFWLAGIFFLMAGLAIAPTFLANQLCGDDLNAHFFRIAQRYLNLVEGGPFSLWGRHLMRGYGYPIFPYYAPFLYWIGALLHLVGLGISPALRLVSWLSLFAAGWGTYRLGRHYYSPAGALIAGLAYQFSPYLFYDAVKRAAIPELLGLAFLPWFIAALEEALVRPGRRATALAGLWLALIFLTHNIISLMAVGIGLGVGLIHLLRLHKAEGGSSRRLLRLVIIPLIGLTISLFFWLPAYLELDQTQIGLASRGAAFVGWPNFDQLFVSPAEIPAWPADPYDPALNNPPDARGLAIPTLILAGLGLAWLLLKKEEMRLILFFWGGLALLTLFLAGENSSFLWGVLPLPTFVQIPFRFLGPAALGVALLAGVPAAVIDDRLSRQPKLSASLIILIGLAVGVSGYFWLYGPVCVLPEQPQGNELAQATNWKPDSVVNVWGGAASGETTPRWVTQLPAADRYTPAYEAGEPVQRLTLPEGELLTSWQSSARGEQYTLTLSQAATLGYGVFYHPQWTVRINDQRVEARPDGPEGLLVFDAPAGVQTIEITFNASPLRQATRTISAVALLLVILVGFRRANRPSEKLTEPGNRFWFICAATALALIGARLFVDRANTPLRAERLVDGRLLDVQHETGIEFSGEFRHLGYKAPARVTAGKPFIVVQYLTPINEIGVVYGFGLRVADEEGRVWSRSLDLLQGKNDFPGARGWIQGMYARDTQLLQILPGTPPGNYWLEAEVFRQDIPFALTPNRENGVDPSKARIGRIQISGSSAPEQADFAVDVVADPPQPLLEGIDLRGWSVPDAPWRPGEQPLIDLLWLVGKRAGLPVAPINEVELHLRDGAGKTVTRLPFRPVWTTGAAQEDSLLRDRLVWPLPADLPDGRFSVILAAGGGNFSGGNHRPCPRTPV